MGQVGAGAQLLHGVDDARVPAEDVAGSGDVETESVNHHARCERSGQLRAQLDVAGEGVDQAVDLKSGLVGEALTDCVEAKGAGEGRAVPGVLGAVRRKHARSRDLAGRKARVVDRQADVIAHRGEVVLARRDHPSAERRDPDNRPDGAQSRERGVGVAFEILDGHPVRRWHPRVHAGSVALLRSVARARLRLCSSSRAYPARRSGSNGLRARRHDSVGTW